VIPEPHLPMVTCEQMCDWEKRIKNMSAISDPTERWLMFRAKKCPKCKGLTVKCGCGDRPICEDMDYCPNHACNHMSCQHCGHGYCWICLGPWRSHRGYYDCNADINVEGEEKQVGIRFKHMYNHYITHRSGWDAANRKLEAWSDLAPTLGLVAEEHPFGKFLAMVVTIEQILKYSFISLFYLSRVGYRAWRQRQKPLEALINDMKVYMEEISRDLAGAAKNKAKVQELADSLVDLQSQLDEELGILRGWFWKDGEQAPITECDSTKFKDDFISEEAKEAGMEIGRYRWRIGQ